jgi:hypothetical protein
LSNDMSIRTCGKCGESFKFPYLLKRHEQRKTPCDIKLAKASAKSKHQCMDCLRDYSTTSHLIRHRKECRAAQQPKTKEENKDLHAEVSRLSALVEKLVSQAPLLTEQKKDTSATSVVQTGNTANSHNNNTTTNTINNTTINVFGKEDIKHISPVDVMKLLREANRDHPADEQKAARRAVLGAVLLRYSDEKRPENITCFMPNIKGKGAMVHGESGWEVLPLSQVVPVIVRGGMDVLFERQPFPGLEGVENEENVDDVGKGLRYIADHEKTDIPATVGAELPAVLGRNKGFLERHNGKLPKAGES